MKGCMEDGFSKITRTGRTLGRIIPLSPMVRRNKVEDRTRPVKACDQILVVFVFDNLPKPRVTVKPICESFPGAFSEDPQGICSSESL